MASFRSKLIEFWMRITGAKAITNMIDVVYPLDASHMKPTWRMKRRHNISEDDFMRHKVYTVTSKATRSGKYVLYLHGGAYYNSFLAPHWTFIDDIVTRSNCTVIAPDFPLAPMATFEDIFGMIVPLYKKMVDEHGAKNITIIGDSSGGGMVLSLAQIVRNAGLEQPKALVLMSPWLDITMSNPGIIEANRKDPFIGLYSCLSAGKRYAKNDDPKRFEISPIYGTIDRLAPINVFVGTHDIMLPDCLKLKGMAEDLGIALNFRQYEDMIHVWMLLSLQESVDARLEICDIINGIKSDGHIKAT